MNKTNQKKPRRQEENLSSDKKKLQTLKDINRMPRWTIILFITLGVLGIFGTVGYFGYQHYQKEARIEEQHKKNVEGIILKASNYNTEAQVIQYIAPLGTAYARYAIGSPSHKAVNYQGYNFKDISGLDYREVDYFKISGTDFYIRSEFGSDSNQTFAIQLVEPKQLKTYTDFDKLQSEFAKSVTKGHPDIALKNKIISMKQKYKYLKN